MPAGRAEVRGRLAWLADSRASTQLADGAGLAATQVGWLRRVFAFRLSREDTTDVLVNPRVVRCEEFSASLMQQEMGELLAMS